MLRALLRLPSTPGDVCFFVPPSFCERRNTETIQRLMADVGACCGKIFVPSLASSIARKKKSANFVPNQQEGRLGLAHDQLQRFFVLVRSTLSPVCEAPPSLSCSARRRFSDTRGFGLLKDVARVRPFTRVRSKVLGPQKIAVVTVVKVRSSPSDYMILRIHRWMSRQPTRLSGTRNR